MSVTDWYAWRAARALMRDDPDFYGLLMAAMWKADTFNAARLRAAFPDVWAETQARYDAPGGLLDSDPETLRDKVLSGEVNW